MTFLYTLPDCPACENVKSKLEEEFVEVVIDNPVLSLGVKTLIRKPNVVAPLLVRVWGDKATAYYPTPNSNGGISFLAIK